MNQLHTFAISHYCERARWALDVAKKPYTETYHVAGFHSAPIKKLSGKTMLPVLELEGNVIAGSGAITQWCLGDSPDEQFEAQLDNQLGSLVRRFTYAASLRQPNSGVRDVLLSKGSAWQRKVMSLAWPMLIGIMEKSMNVALDRLPSITAALEKDLAQLDQKIQDQKTRGSLYLAGGSFSRLDITAASLLAPIAKPEQLPLYQRVSYLPPQQALVNSWQSRPSFIWVREIYAKHRH